MSAYIVNMTKEIYNPPKRMGSVAMKRVEVVRTIFSNGKGKPSALVFEEINFNINEEEIKLAIAIDENKNREEFTDYNKFLVWIMNLSDILIEDQRFEVHCEQGNTKTVAVFSVEKTDATTETANLFHFEVYDTRFDRKIEHLCCNTYNCWEEVARIKDWLRPTSRRRTTNVLLNGFDITGHFMHPEYVDFSWNNCDNPDNFQSRYDLTFWSVQEAKKQIEHQRFDLAHLIQRYYRENGLDIEGDILV